jgi:hypothetical protein
VTSRPAQPLALRNPKHRRNRGTYMPCFDILGARFE